MKIEILKAKREDCHVILDFIKILAKYEKLEQEVSADVPLLEKTLFEDKTSTEVYLGYFEKTPVSMALIFQNFSTFLGKSGIYLEDLIVHENYRGKGYGKMMLQFLAKLAVERNCGRLEWSVLDWNKPAIDFYKSIGAVTMDGWLTHRLTGDSMQKIASEFPG